MSTRVLLWYLLIDHKTIPIGHPYAADVASDTYVIFLLEKIKETRSQVLANVDVGTLNAWKLLDPPDVNDVFDATDSMQFLGNIRQHLSPSVTGSETLARPLRAETISELGAWPEKKLHVIVQLPAPVISTSDNLASIESGNYPREVVIKLPDLTRLVHLEEAHLFLNHVAPSVRSSQRFQTLQKHLRRKRYIDEQELSSALALRTSWRELFQGLSNEYFESRIPAETLPLERVTDNELGHYFNILSSSVLSKAVVFTNKRECHIYALLLNFLATWESTSSEFCFGTYIPFHLVIETPSQNFMHTPRPDFHMRIGKFPHILLEVVSQKNESDRYRMLLQASCLARFGNRIRSSEYKEPVVIMAIYVDKHFMATQYLVSACTEVEAECVSQQFDLTDRRAAFEFIFQLYNFLSIAKADNDNFDGLGSQVAATNQLVANKGYQAFTSSVPTKRRRGASENSSDSSPSGANHGAAHDSFGNSSIQEGLATAGYTLTQFPEDLTPLTPLKPTMRQATSRIGISVVLKIIRDSNERELLQHLGAIKARSNHTIPLLEVIDLSIGKTIIVLPLKTPLDEVLQLRDRPDDVASLCTQFIRGVAFLHHHKVAHCDLKPGNVVVDTTRESRTSPRLFIIDFDLAQFVESEETVVEGWRGTPPWIAPELGSRDGPIQQYSPILADRWTCGLMIKYFAKYIPTHVNKQSLLALAQQLLNVNPRARPPLNQLRVSDGPTKRILEGNQHEHEPVRKHAR